MSGLNFYRRKSIVKPISARGAVIVGGETLSKGAAYDPDASLLFSRITNQPNAARKDLINATIIALKDAFIFQRSPALYFKAGADAQTARLNWAGPAYDLTAVGSPTFAPDRGYQGDGATSYLETGFNPSVIADPRYSRDSATVGAYSRTVGQGVSGSIEVGSINSWVQMRTTSDFCNGRIHSATSSSAANFSAVGLFCSSRTSAGQQSIYKNGALLVTGNVASDAPGNNTIQFLNRGGVSSFSGRQLSFGIIASGLDATDHANLWTIVRNYLQAVGAA